MVMLAVAPVTVTVPSGMLPHPLFSAMVLPLKETSQEPPFRSSPKLKVCAPCPITVYLNRTLVLFGLVLWHEVIVTLESWAEAVKFSSAGLFPELLRCRFMKCHVPFSRVACA